MASGSHIPSPEASHHAPPQESCQRLASLLIQSLTHTPKHRWTWQDHPRLSSPPMLTLKSKNSTERGLFSRDAETQCSAIPSTQETQHDYMDDVVLCAQQAGGSPCRQWDSHKGVPQGCAGDWGVFRGQQEN